MDGEVTTNNWSEAVEDLVEDGEFDKAISVLESVVSELETPSPSSKVDLQLSSALLDLAKLYSAKDLSLKADEARSRALLLKNRTDSYERDVKNTKEDSAQCSQAPSESCDGSSNEDEPSAILLNRMDGEVTTNNWSEAVEDLVEDGEFDKAISVLESVVSELETPTRSSKVDLQLSSALLDLAKLYSAKDLSLKADEARSRALLLKNRTGSCERDVKNTKEDSAQCSEAPSESCDGSSNEDDWEAIADRAPEELLSPERLPEVSKLSLKDTETPKRRGRGTFAYTTNGLYSSQDAYPPTIDSPENEAQCHSPERDAQVPKLKYGTRHIVVLADFPPSTATADLEKLFRNFKGHEVVIRWVNDTTALAVFKTPSIALDACNHIKCPFTVRILEEDDVLLKSIRPRDTEPPRQRPETSVQTARRLIAQGMGIKLPSTNFGSRELRKQEEARRNRIVSRQNMKDDAWGDDD